MRNAPAQTRGSNRLLDLLPPRERERLVSSMEYGVYNHKAEVFRRYSQIKDVWFPVRGVISLVIEMKDGSSSEVGIVGNEGMAGLPLTMGATQSSVHAFFQVPGEALRMPANDFRREIARRGRFEQILRRYSQTFFDQIAQSTACNRLHEVQQRLCRWLLMCHDRVGGTTIDLTQEFLAQMLGVRRSSVNTAAGALQRQGFINYHRGQIEILDRPAIEVASCECYTVVLASYNRLML